MRKKKAPDKVRGEQGFDRRQVLKGFGVVAVAVPALACGSNGAGAGSGGVTGSGGAASGGALGSGGAASGGISGSGGLLGTGGLHDSGGIVGSGGVLGSGGTASGGSGSGGVVGSGGVGGKVGFGGDAAGGAPGSGGAAGAPAAAGGQGGGMPPHPMFDNVATCTLTPTDPAGEGPFFIHNEEVMKDVDLFRPDGDMRDGTPGVEFQINLRVLDTSMGCTVPVSDVEVYVWHTNATGFYSGFDGQNPDQPYSGAAERMPDNDNLDRFCRGAAVTDKDGIVRFTSIFPGWYDGRAIHVHFVALRKGSDAGTSSADMLSYRGRQYMIFTTQFYFDESFSRSIHENNDPYKARTTGSYATNYARYVKPEQNVRPTMTKSGNVVIGALNILTDSTGSRGAAQTKS